MYLTRTGAKRDTYPIVIDIRQIHDPYFNEKSLILNMGF